MRLFAVLLSLTIFLGACGPKVASIRTEEISFISQGDTIKGVLSKPKGKGPFPAVVMIHGSAPATRKNFQEYTRAFVHQGIAVLNYDKRGCGESGGVMWYADFADLGADAAAGMAHLAARPEIDTTRLGYWAISQGAWVMHLANERERADFFIGISAPTITPRDQIRYHTSSIVLENGGTEAFAERFNDYLGGYIDYLRTREGYEAWMREDSLLQIDDRMRWLDDFFAFSDLVHRQPPSELPPFDSCEVNPSARNLDFDPLPYYEKLDQPILLVYGRNDNSLPLRDCLERVLPAARREGQIQFKAYFNADHGIRESYAGGNRHPEGYMDLLGAFIKDPGMRIVSE